MGSRDVSYEVWVRRFRDVYGDKYEYGNILPRENGNNRKIEIFCKEHGKFLKYLGKHWKNTTAAGNIGSGECPKCRTHSTKRVGYTEADWICEFKANQPVSYDYSTVEFISGHKIKVDCSDHGWFTQSKSTHAAGTVGCTGCWFYIRGNDFKFSAEKLFPGKYDYSLFNYTDSREPSTIVCRTHGSFELSPNRFLSGKYPCPSCYKIARSVLHPGGVGGYSKKVFDRDPEIAESPACVYYIKIGGYYKVGISTDVHKRLTALKSKSKMNIEILDKHECRLYDAYKIEQFILIANSSNRTRTIWSAELFDTDVLDGVGLEKVVPDPEILKLIP